MRKEKWNMKQGYRIINSRVDYKNPYFRIRRERVVLPDGRKKDYFILDKGGIFSIIIPITEEGKTYLVGQYRPAPGVYSWEFPMGYAEGEDALGMGKTELKEETGLTAGRWEEIGRFNLAPGHTGQVGHVFVAEDLTKGEPEFEENEFIDVRPDLEIEEVGKMIRGGEIIDGPTIVAYHFLSEHMDSRKHKNTKARKHENNI